ncbi:MAG TPA: SsrA-binding protein SmpB [Aggregatilinea sp.]|jgi:SsrA-binding protein|uniref:SsrA-binding protein SmpB n=1 Tax=Aggregatilinea sp. TaxID=2806333 RepID=UPI002C28A85F|nr:SsrA-binding protein SmpB [Aggregatilinea sp.]HML20152.1 SsrA-binding protein SmpB [Aggregatilinea sp.]
MEQGRKVISTNRKAWHDYEFMETLEAGLVLTGSEIKSIRAGHANLREGYIQPRDGELWLLNVHIASYDEAGKFGHDPLRPRKLLVHRREIIHLLSRVQEKGLTLIPIQLYLVRGKAKVEIALARGKKQYDKRSALREKDTQRQIERALRERNQ